jgi:signal transduction histidine kinase
MHLLASLARQAARADLAAVDGAGDPMPIDIDPGSSLTEADLRNDSEPRERSELRVPFVRSGGRVQTLVLIRERRNARFDLSDRLMVTEFARQVTIVLELAGALVDRGRLALLEDRDRIARDLHDLVIQRLFATGLALQGLRAKWPDGPDADRIDRAVDDLDETVREIRRAIFALRERDEHGLRSTLLDIVALARAQLGLRPEVTWSGPVDFVTTPELVAAARAVLTETLSNVGRHAHATNVSVIVEVDAEWLRINVTDDGKGIGTATRRSGLANLRVRAEELGGVLELSAPPGGGTIVSWQVPLGTAISSR